LSGKLQQPQTVASTKATAVLQTV